MDYQYFEVCIGHGPEESDHDFRMCIRGVKVPTIAEIELFCAADVSLYGGHVLGVYPIDKETAESCYDFGNESNWPVFGH